MAGTKQGAIKAKKTIFEKYGKNYFVELGKKSGGKPKKNTFLSLHPEFAKYIGSIGGKKSKRGKENKCN